MNCVATVEVVADESSAVVAALMFRSSAQGSEDFLDQVHWPVGQDLSNANGNQSVHKRVFRFRRLEARRRAEVGSFRSSVVTDAVERHVDQRAVVGFQSHPQVELDDTVQTFHGPIVTAGEHLAAKPRPFERTTSDGKGDPRAARPGTDVLRGCGLETKRHQRLRSHELFGSQRISSMVYIGPSGRRSPLETATSRFSQLYFGTPVSNRGVVRK